MGVVIHLDSYLRDTFGLLGMPETNFNGLSTRMALRVWKERVFDSEPSFVSKNVSKLKFDSVPLFNDNDTYPVTTTIKSIIFHPLRKYDPL